MNCWYGGTLKVAALMAAIFTLGACKATINTGSPSAQRTTATPVSPAAYRNALLAGLAPVNTALGKLAGAGSYKELTARISDLESAADQAATTLGGQAPPSAVAAEHAKLTAALRQFGDDLSTLGDDVSGRGLCTTSSARGQLGRADGTAALRAAVAALAAKSPDYQIPLNLPSAQKQSTHRLANGHFLRSGSRGGRGSLTIDNGRDSDAVVTLAIGKHPKLSVYVRKNKKFTVHGITDGTYKVFFAGGVDWDAKTHRFARKCAFQQFDDTLPFKTIRTATQIRWKTWSISLQPVAGGTASTRDVDPGDYPET